MRGKIYVIRYANFVLLFIKICCVYLPQRYGLIGWGYFKLIIDCLMIALEFYSVLDRFFITCADNGFCSIYISNTNFKIILYIIFVTDLGLAMIYKFGRHMKNLTMLKVAYYYGQVIWVYVVLIMAVTFGIIVVYALHGFYPTDGWILLAVNFSYLFVNIATQTYFLLMLRSEIMKLNSNSKIRFVNNAADAECMMARKNDVTYRENGIETA